ncbi:hypothetical protein FQN57_000615 [Myotisia sp. PD_48]|nr:hypothetical protein FQN57_000615 [Myotisia sp. PD_48]
MLIRWALRLPPPTTTPYDTPVTIAVAVSEPKHFANQVAIRVWEAEKAKHHILGDSYRQQRPFRAVREAQTNSLNFSSSFSTESSPGTQNFPHSATSYPSQDTALSGSVFCPSTQETQSSIAPSIHNLSSSSGFSSGTRQFDQNSNPTVNNQGRVIPNSVTTLNSSYASTDLLQFSSSESQPHSSYPIEDFHTQVPASVATKNNIYSTPSRIATTSTDWGKIFEIAETPPSRLFIEESLDPSRPVPVCSMNNQQSNRTSPAPASAGEATVNESGSSLGDTIARLWAADSARVKPLQSILLKETASRPTSIEPLPQVSSSTCDIISPLAIREDKDIVAAIEPVEANEAAIAFVAPQELHYDVERATALPDVQAAAPGLEFSSILEQDTEMVDTANEAVLQPETTRLDLHPQEFDIPLSMDCRVKDDYETTFANESKYIQKFLDTVTDSGSTENDESETKALLGRMENMIERLNNITTHPDLNLASQPTEGPPEVRGEASWAEYSSSKFQFLGYFIPVAETHDIHIIIMIQDGQAVEIVKNYLLGKQFDQIPEIPLLAFRKNLLTLEVRSTGDPRDIQSFKPPSAILALDHSFDVDSLFIRQLRKRPDTNSLVPVFRLIVANTAEHVERCLPACSPLTKLRLLVQYTMFFSDNAGELQADALGVQEYAEEAWDYTISDPSTREWKVPLIESLDIAVADEHGSIPEPEELREAITSGQKRWLANEAGDIGTPSKRPRMSPNEDVSHISDSHKGQTQSNTTLTQDQTFSFPAPTSANFEVLRKQLAKAATHLEAMTSSCSSLQYRYEAQTNLLHQKRQELEVAQAAAKKAEARLERQKVEISRLKDENIKLTSDLAEARNTIKSGGGLESDLEQAREQIRKLELSKASLEKTLNLEQKQTEYTRQQYQKASTSAAQSGNQLRQYEEKVQDLEKKASGEAARLKELKMKSDEKTYLLRIKALQGALASREELLSRKEEEIRELRKNRPSTRAASIQPRSPKTVPSRSTSPGSNSLNSTIRGSSLKFRTEM